MTTIIRMAAPEDAGQIAEIYAPAVTGAVVSFEMEPPGAAEMARRVTDTLVMYPWLVAERGGEVLGYARAGQYKERAAYRWSVETSVYIRATAHRTGLGRALYVALFDLLVMQGFFMAYAGVTLPNPGSVGLHESLGYTLVGVYRTAGYKFGAWHDVGWWQRPLQPLLMEPPEPKPIGTISAQRIGAIPGAVLGGRS
jgi:L-amino acid N-acyltransferase YncA